MADTVITQDGIDAVHYTYASGSLFAIKYFLPLYDPRIDPNIHNTPPSSADSLSTYELVDTCPVSATHDNVFGERLFNTVGNAISETAFYLYRIDGEGTLTPDGTSATLTGISQTKPLQTNIFREVAPPFTSYSTMQVVSGSNITGSNGNFQIYDYGIVPNYDESTMGDLADRLFKVHSFAPSIGVSAERGQYTAVLDGSVGNFKFNKIAFYVQKVNPDFTDYVGFDPILFCITPISTVAVKTSGSDVSNVGNYGNIGVDGMSRIEHILELEFATSASITNTSYQLVDYWTALPPVYGNGISYHGDVVVGSSAIDGSYDPLGHHTSWDITKAQYAAAYGLDKVTYFKTTEDGYTHIDTSGATRSNLNIGLDNTLSGAKSSVFGKDSLVSGDYSFAFGEYTSATGDRAFAFGENNLASGNNSFVGGLDSLASGLRSFAFGNLCSAEGDQAFAIGNSNIAAGNYAAAIGLANQSNGSSTIAIGNSNIVSGSFSGAFGFGNNISGSGNFGIGISNIGTGTGNAIFGGNNYEALSTYSIIFGEETSATSNVYSIVGGYQTSAYNNVRTFSIEKSGLIQDSQFSMSIGEFNTAKENTYALLFGNSLNVSGTNYSSTFGVANNIKSDYAFVIGASNTVNPEIESCFIFGNSNICREEGSAPNSFMNFIFGRSNITGDGYYNFIHGLNNEVSAVYSTTLGLNNRNYATASFVGGSNSEVGREESAISAYTAAFAYGLAVKAKGDYSQAFGSYTVAYGSNSFAAGKSTTVNGNYSFAHGEFIVIATAAINSGAIGKSHNVQSKSSFTGGEANTLYGKYDVALGYSNVTGNSTSGEDVEYANVAIGYDNTARSKGGNTAVAIGSSSSALAAGSAALGHDIIIDQDAFFSRSFGYTNRVYGNNSFVFGHNALLNASITNAMVFNLTNVGTSDYTTIGASDAFVFNTESTSYAAYIRNIGIGLGLRIDYNTRDQYNIGFALNSIADEGTSKQFPFGITKAGNIFHDSTPNSADSYKIKTGGGIIALTGKLGVYIDTGIPKSSNSIYGFNVMIDAEGTVGYDPLSTTATSAYSQAWTNSTSLNTASVTSEFGFTAQIVASATEDNYLIAFGNREGTLMDADRSVTYRWHAIYRSSS